MSLEQKKRVCYFYDANVGNYHYGPGHPMRPHRIRMCHGLVMNYQLYKKMEIYRAKPATKWEMTQFHTDDYIDFLSRVTPENMDQYQKDQAKFNVGDDSPVFEGLFEYCGLSAGGSMEGAARLNRGLCDIAINWAGGLHHAKKAEASGFCYVNDIVLGILELLRYYPRVLYIDIDVHHGDGVEEAFYTTDRVMCVSFHKYGEFFPGTGELNDVGADRGKYYSVNFPLRDGIDDESYKSVFEPVIEKVMEWYRPGAVVLQCGGDSLSGDKLGCFNLSMKGHASCVSFVKKFNLPTLVLGGGGYTMRNVARAWAYETGVIVGEEIGPEMPYNDYYEYFGPDYKLDVRPSNMENMNTQDYLEKIKMQVYENLSRTLFAPSVQMQEVPRDQDMSEDEDGEDPDNRESQSQWDRRIVPENEFYDSDEGEAQGSRTNGKSRHHQKYDDDSQDYDGGDESDGQKTNDKDTSTAGNTRLSSMSVDGQQDVDMTEEEKKQIEDALLEHKAQEETKEETLQDAPAETHADETQDDSMDVDPVEPTTVPPPNAGVLTEEKVDESTALVGAQKEQAPDAPAVPEPNHASIIPSIPSDTVSDAPAPAPVSAPASASASASPSEPTAPSQPSPAMTEERSAEPAMPLPAIAALSSELLKDNEPAESEEEGEVTSPAPAQTEIKEEPTFNEKEASSSAKEEPAKGPATLIDEETLEDGEIADSPHAS